MSIDLITPGPTRHHRAGRRPRRVRALAAAALLAVAPLSLAACGGDDAAAGDGAAAAGGTSSSEELQAFQECLAENGVELGAPPDQQGSSESGDTAQMPDQEAMAQAQEACADLAPEGMAQGGGPGMGQGGPGGEELIAYVECLADNGVEVAAPGASGEPPSGEPPAAGEDMAPPEGGAMFGLDESDPEVAAAIEACAELAPEAPSGGAPTTDDSAAATESS